MAVADFDAQYGGYGVPAIGPNTPNDSALDSGAVAVSSTPHTTTLTVGTNTIGGTDQPTVIRGKLVMCFSGLNASAVLGAIDVAVSDGSLTEYVGCIPGSNQATAGQGATFVLDIFISRLTCTTIKTVTIRSNTTGNNNYTKQCRFLAERD